MDDASLRLADLVDWLSLADSVEELQRRFLTRVGTMVSSFAAGIYVLDPVSGRVRAMEAVGVSDFFLGRYEELGRAMDPVLREVVGRAHAVDSAQLMTGEAWTGSEFYRGVLHLHHMAHLLQAPVVLGGAVIGTLNFGRHRDEGPFTDAERTIADVLGRMVGVVVDALDARALAGRERERALATLDLVDDAVVVSDVETGERLPNAAARALLRRLEQGDALLDELVAYPERCDAVDVRALPAQLSGEGAVRLEARTAALSGRQEVLVTFLGVAFGDEPARPSGGLTGVLTERERDVAALAARGLHDREIAERLFLSPHTVKQHLKAAYRKLGVRSRIDLARLGAGRPPLPPPS